MRWCALLMVVGCGFAPASSGDANRGDGGGSDPPIDAPPDAYVAPTSPRTITIHAGLTAATLTNIPILVSLDPAKIDYAQVADPNTDLEFDTNTLTKLYYDVESWNPGGVSAVWVLVPSIPLADTTLTMSWGHGLGTSNSVMTWANYESVLHGAAPLTDPSGALYAPTGINVTAPDGRAGKAIGFGGAGDHRVTFANGDQLFAQWSAFSIQFWIYADYPSLAAFGNTPKSIMDEGGSLTLGRFYPSSNNVDLTLQTDFHFTGNNNAFLNTDVPLRTWTHIGYVFTGTAFRMFKNGVQTGNTFNMSGGNNENLLSPTGAFYLGETAGLSFVGALDELEIDQRAHNIEWVRTQYAAMAGQLLTWH